MRVIPACPESQRKVLKRGEILNALQLNNKKKNVGDALQNKKADALCAKIMVFLIKNR
ncbi:hypothetical protein HON22_02570 [Candidatus Peregrinibacteria bacterium]|jgi:hypothetical protein|nr:hypothetical protein [Candidatus Peregrinibacteria bacterium]